MGSRFFRRACLLGCLGFRALPVGVAGSPGALAVRRSFIRQYWPVWEVGSFAGRAWRGIGHGHGHGHLLKKVEFPPPTPARIVMVLCWVMVYSGGPAVALALAGRARAVPLVRSRRASGAGRCAIVFTFCTYGTGQWVVLEVTYILPLTGHWAGQGFPRGQP